MFRRRNNDVQPGPGAPPPPRETGIPPARPETRRPRLRPGDGRRRGLWLYIFAFIGFLAVCFLLIRYLIVPLLVALA